ncbi:MAG: DUF4381 domain-containing protein [Cocleimonas sp.]|nr:DUF4381 domain-containing protein [Cocleimonas sp.]
MDTLQLQDIHLPENASFWPLALGWWLLLAVLIVVIAWLIVKILKRAKQRKYRAKIFARFDDLEKKLKTKPSNAVIAELNTLLRQLAVNYYPRSKTASLTGGEWLQFLDQSGGTQGFSRGAGRILIEAPYRLEKEIENLNIKELIPLIRRWTRKVVRANS